MTFEWNFSKYIKRNKRDPYADDSDMKVLEQRPAKNTRLRPSRSFNEIFAIRNSEYVPEYNARMPKAAGFQKFTKNRIDDLVHRMYDSRVKKEQKATRESDPPHRNEPLLWMPLRAETLPRSRRIQTPRDDERLSQQRRIQTPAVDETLPQSKRMRTPAGSETSIPPSRRGQTALIETPFESAQKSSRLKTTSTQRRRKLTVHEDRIIGECLNQPTVTSLIRKMLRTPSPFDVKDVSLYCKQCRIPVSQRKTRSPYYNFFLDETDRIYLMQKRK